MRDIEKRVEEGARLMAKHSRVDMSAGELLTFRGKFIIKEMESGKDAAVLEMIHEVFCFGVSVGQRVKNN